MNFGASINLTKNILDYSNTKNNVITNNLANINNPEYKRKYMEDLSFNSCFEDEMKRNMCMVCILAQSRYSVHGISLSCASLFLGNGVFEICFII